MNTETFSPKAFTALTMRNGEWALGCRDKGDGHRQGHAEARHSSEDRAWQWRRGSWEDWSVSGAGTWGWWQGMSLQCLPS